MPPHAIEIKDFNGFYGGKHALVNVNMTIEENEIVAFIGPSGCGKTTLLRSINRLNDLKKVYQSTGEIEIKGQDIYQLTAPKAINTMRQSIGMVFQQPNLLPTSIYKNMALPLTEHFKLDPENLDKQIREHLEKSGIWEEVKDRLHESALALSGGQQQRLCIARALMLNPKILLLDEPCSALDPISTGIIEDLLVSLKDTCTIIIVTHNMGQAARIADKTAFFFQGSVVESGETAQLFVNPKTVLCANYVAGKF